MMSKKVYLSYIIDEKTPTYGNRNIFKIEKKSSIPNGDVANDSSIKTTVHTGTHLDMPYHFYEDGQTVEDFNADFFEFNDILYIELKPKETVIKNELIERLEKVSNKDKYDILIVKTGICHKREEDVFWKENYGFHPEIANYLKENFPNVRVFGFDSISVSSFTDRMTGREAHKAFLNPKHPILLLEDMDLRSLTKESDIYQLIIAPIRISKCDGLPCTIVVEIQKW